jgi:hypothetical protein
MNLVGWPAPGVRTSNWRCREDGLSIDTHVAG